MDREHKRKGQISAASSCVHLLGTDLQLKHEHAAIAIADVVQCIRIVPTMGQGIK